MGKKSKGTKKGKTKRAPSIKHCSQCNKQGVNSRTHEQHANAALATPTPTYSF